MFLRFVLLVTATIEVTMNNLGWKQKKEELVAMPGLGTQEASCLCHCSLCFRCNKCTYYCCACDCGIGIIAVSALNDFAANPACMASLFLVLLFCVLLVAVVVAVAVALCCCCC